MRPPAVAGEGAASAPEGDGAALRRLVAGQAAVLASLRNLASYPFVTERVAAGRLALHGWYFHLGWGVLQAAAGPRGPFRQLDAAAAPVPALGRFPSPPDAPA